MYIYIKVRQNDGSTSVVVLRECCSDEIIVITHTGNFF